MSDRRKKPMSRDQRLPRRESNLTEKSIYKENPRDIVVFLDHATCPRLSTAKCVLSVVTKAMISNVVDPHLYSTPIDDLLRWLGKSSFSFSLVFPSTTRFCRIDPADIVGRFIDRNTVGNCVILFIRELCTREL